jgi:flagellar hook-associated protein 1 FlgK
VIDGLTIGVSGLLAAQRGLDVTSHNLANVNTPGYARQRLTLQEAPPITGFRPGKGEGAFGVGVVVRSVDSVRDLLVEATIREQQADIGSLTATADLATRVDEVLGTLNGGVGDILGRFWSAWDQLSINPQLTANRNAVLEAGRDLAAAIQQAAGILDTVAEEAATRLADQIDEVNTLARNVGLLNRSIVEIQASGGTAGDMINERTRAIDRLAYLTGATVRMTDAGSAEVHIPGGLLVGGGQAAELSLAGDPPNVVWAGNGSTAATRGSTEVLRQTVADGFSDLRDRYDLLANGIRTAVNTVHKAGKDLDNVAGLDFFTGTGAANFAVNPAVTARKVAASAGGAAVDGNQAVAIAALRNQRIIADPADPGTLVDTPSQSLATLLSEIGRRADSAQRDQEAATTVGNQLEARRAQVSGVSVDEELTELLRYQRAYEASARIITVMGEVMDVLVNLGAR